LFAGLCGTQPTELCADVGFALRTPGIRRRACPGALCLPALGVLLPAGSAGRQQQPDNADQTPSRQVTGPHAASPLSPPQGLTRHPPGRRRQFASSTNRSHGLTKIECIPRDR
jgi:hypothetical protein